MALSSFVSYPSLSNKLIVLGVVSTVAGCGKNGIKDGIGTAATFNYPMDVAIDQLGNILVVENHAVRMITRQGLGHRCAYMLLFCL